MSFKFQHKAVVGAVFVGLVLGQTSLAKAQDIKNSAQQTLAKKKNIKKKVKKAKSSKTAKATPEQKAAIAEASQILAKNNIKSDSSATTTPVSAIKEPTAVNQKASSTTLQANPFTGASLTKVDSAEKKQAPSKFAFTWVSYNAIDTGALENIPGNDGEFRGWQIPTFIFNFNKEVSVSMMPQFFNSWFGNPNRLQDDKVKAAGEEVGQTQPYSLYMGNIAFSLTHKALVKNDKGFRLEGIVRYDAPTSERSSLNGSYGENWNTLTFNQSLGKFDLSLQLIGRIYFQRYKTSSLLAAGGGNKDKQVQNPSFRDYELLNIGYNITPKFSTTLTGGAYNTSYYDDPNNNRPEYVRSIRIVNLDFTYAFSKSFILSVGILDEMAIGGKHTWSDIPFDPQANDGGEVYIQGTFKI